MKILTFSSLYPNAEQPRHGIFVEQRLRRLVGSGDVEARVVAPVPWFPWRHERYGLYGTYARVASRETRHGLDIEHPRYGTVPKIGMTVAPALMALGTLGTLRRIRREGYHFDLIDAHYLYPDGVAAVWLGQRLGCPVTISARGSDVNLIARYALPRRMIRWAAARADAVIAVADALKRRLVHIGVPQERVTVLRNCVDLDLFTPAGQRERSGRGDRRTLLSVGNLIELKGHDLVIRAVAELPDTELVIVGDGPMAEPLRRCAEQHKVSDRVRFVGVMPQEELRRLYAAADALVLASSSEGLANVLLEAMACDTPVVATRVGGAAEVVNSPAAGRLVGERSVAGIVRAVGDLMADYPQPGATRRHAEQFGWASTIRNQVALYESILAAGCMVSA